MTLTADQLPSHAHGTQGSTDFATDTSPAGNLHGAGAGTNLYTTGTSSLVSMDGDTIAVTGGQSHTNLMPYQCVNFIIALFGIFPSQT